MGWYVDWEAVRHGRGAGASFWHDARPARLGLERDLARDVTPERPTRVTHHPTSFA
jgi:hypothetical protein